MLKRLACLLTLFASASSLFAATSGAVFSTGGEAVAGAKVEVRRAESMAERRSRIAEGKEPAVLAGAVTADNGSFSLDAKSGGVLELFVERGGYAPAALRVLSGDGDIVITVAPAQERTGRVTAAGKPVAGALILARNDQTFLWSTRTNEQGAYTIPDPRGWCSGLVVVHPDYAPSTVAARSGGELALNVTLETGRVVSGTVVGSDGRPVPKARVAAGPWQETVAGEDGAFTLRHVAASVREITASDGSRFASLPAFEKGPVFRLQPGRSISGTVRDADKRPLTGAVITRYAAQDPFDLAVATSAVTDDKGNYEIPHGEPAGYGLFASAGGDLSFEPTKVSLRSKKSAQVDFTATPIRYLRGVVTDERKRPVAGATVQWVIAEMPIVYGFVEEGEGGSTQSGTDGRFRLTLPADDRRLQKAEVRLQALRSGYAVGLTEPLKIADKSKSVTITLPDGITLPGIVTDADGAPVSGAAIALIQDPFGAVPLPIDALLASGTVAPWLRSDSEGKFLLHLNAAPHDLSVWKKGFAGFRRGGISPRSEAMLNVRLEKGVEIRGRVTRKGSTAPIEGSIQARGDDVSFAQTTIAGDGTFVIGDLHPGSYTVAYENGQGLDLKRVVKAPATDVVLELPAVGTIRGSVVDKATRKAILDYEVAARDATGSFTTAAMTKVDTDGTFLLELQPGSANVFIQAAGYVTEPNAVEVEVGKTSELTVALSAGRTVTGRVLTENGEPVSQASISVDGDSMTAWQSSESEENGEYSISGLPRDGTKLNAQKSGFVGQTIDVGPGSGDTRLDIVLSRGRRASGRVITSEGAPVEGASVWSTSGGRATTGADGAFVIEGLTEPRDSFRASRDDLGSASVDDADLAQEIVITLKTAAGWGSIHGRVEGFSEAGWMYGAVMTSGGDANAPIGRDGTYRLARVTAGEIEVSAMAMSMKGDASAAPVKVTVSPNEDVEVNLAFRSDIVIRGTVTEGARQPAAGRRIRFSGSASSASTTTGEDGSYTLSGIEPGSFTVSVDSTPQSFETRYQVRGSATFDIHIDRGELHGRVVDEAGGPLGGVTVAAEAVGSEASPAQATSDASGTFSIPVFRGPYLLTATKKGYAASPVRVESDSAPVQIKMVASNGLRVRLLDARDGHTLDGYVVATEASGMKLGRLHDAQSDGSILVPLAAGTYRLSASADGYATQSVPATMPRETELRIALTPGGTLIVRADRSSNDVVKLVHPNGEEYVRCECNGIAAIRLEGTTTTIQHIAPGAYTMQVLDDQGRIKTSYPVAIAEGQQTIAEIQVPE